MISTLDPSAQRFLNDLNQSQQRTSRAERQISSGLRVSAPSDAPDQISTILQLHSSIDRNQQIQTNLGQTKTEVDGAEQALQSAVQLMDQAAVLAAQATGPAQTAETRASLAGQVETLQERMVAISQTQVGGKYVFSGDQDQSPCYQLDLTSPNGVDLLQSATATGMVEDTSGTRFRVGLTANQIFDQAPGNVFSTLNALRVALLGNDSAALQALNGTVRTAGDYLNQQLSFYGRTQDRIASAQTTAQNSAVQLQTELSGQQDADMTQAILELTQGQTQQQASLAAEAKLPRSTLFDLLG